jgi:hypothetical protein
VWQFDQQRMIDDVKRNVGVIAPDRLFMMFPYKSSRRENLDMAQTTFTCRPPAATPTANAVFI